MELEFDPAAPASLLLSSTLTMWAQAHLFTFVNLATWLQLDTMKGNRSPGQKPWGIRKEAWEQNAICSASIGHQKLSYVWRWRVLA